MSEKIVSYKGYVAGWLDSSIHDFLEVLPPQRKHEVRLDYLPGQ